MPDLSGSGHERSRVGSSPQRPPEAQTIGRGPSPDGPGWQASVQHRGPTHRVADRGRRSAGQRCTRQRSRWRLAQVRRGRSLALEHLGRCRERPYPAPRRLRSATRWVGPRCCTEGCHLGTSGLGLPCLSSALPEPLGASAGPAPRAQTRTSQAWRGRNRKQHTTGLKDLRFRKRCCYTVGLSGRSAVW